jgi:hypothetical protein
MAKRTVIAEYRPFASIGGLPCTSYAGNHMPEEKEKRRTVAWPGYNSYMPFGLYLDLCLTVLVRFRSRAVIKMHAKH